MPRGLAAVSRRRDFASFAASRHRGRSGPVRVVHVPVDGSDDANVAVAVAYGVGRPVGTAVVRNRVRRRLRSLMRECHAEGLLPAGRYLVSVGPAAAEAEFDALGDDLRTALAALR